MHESHVVADLLARVEREIDPRRERVRRLTLRIGPLSSTGAAALREGLARRARGAWGYAPEVVVDGSDQPADAGVRLVSIVVGD